MAGRVKHIASNGIFDGKRRREYGLELIQQSQKDNVVILGYPPHCTHALQGLDVMCFAPLKKVFHAGVREFEEERHKGLQREDFASVFGAAGISPFDPSVITEDKIAPSKTTGLQAEFPQKLFSPARAILASLTQQPPTAFELSETTVDPNLDPQLYTPTDFIHKDHLCIPGGRACH